MAVIWRVIILSLAFFHCVLATDYTQTSNTWSESDCGPMVRMIMPIAGGLEKCKEECDADLSCTAFEYAETTFNANTDCCILRNCPLPVPTPNVAQANWHGGTFDYSGYASPYPIELGPLKGLKHKVKGDVTILSKKTILISNMEYDGKGPKTFYHVGTDNSIQSLKQNLNNGHQIMYKDHCISSDGTHFNCGTESGYSRIPKMGLSGIPPMDIMVTLPGNLTFPDINWLSLYCRRFRLNFGEMLFTEPPTTPSPALCENKWKNSKCNNPKTKKRCKKQKSVRNNCQLTCGVCCGNIMKSSICENRKAKCYEKRMKKNCKKTCNLC